MGIHDVSQTVHKLWNGWELRTVILLSLFLQVFLVLFASRRKYTAGFWLGTFVWLAYLSADRVATFSLGILAQRLGDSETNCTNPNPGFIPAFWAPVLLAHLGGPDTITAYSVEDNELWLRHLLELGSQVVVAFYAFLRSWWSKDPLLFVAVPIFLAGMIKYGERIGVLRSASSEQLMSSKYKEMNELRSQFNRFSNSEFFEMTDELETTDERLIQRLGLNDIIPEAKFLHEANLFFQMFGVLHADLVLSDSNHLASYLILRNKTAEDAFHIIEVEMGFMYDVLFTKVSRIRLSHIIRRAVSLLCFVSALLAFSLGMSKNNHAYLTTEITVSYLLLVGAIIIEIYGAVFLLFSDWAMLWLSGQKKPLFNLVYRTIWSSLFRSFLHNNKWWTGSMAQHNLRSAQLTENKWFDISIIKKLLGKSHIQSWEVVSLELKKLIFEQLKDKRSRYSYRMRTYDPGKNDLHEILSERGDQVIGGERCLEKLGWSVNCSDFNESLLMWHIATDICYHYDFPKDGGDANNVHPSCKMSISLSNYMVYLLCDCPFLLPKGIGKERYNQTCIDVSQFSTSLKRIISGGSDLDGFIETLELQGSQVSGLFNGSKLAKALQSLVTEDGWENERKWEMISKVWVEMLTYAASHCGWKEHAQSLTRGGELVTHVCLLMAHLGLSEQCLTN
ncbi:unnamed protein product [Dovyalis caffra]|uniref:DUF4220 domain-containing protein n=1 Tax=Dovyalis caffra TaxID=77055 RepID=A0AAV1S1U9_9ROSI|nr:unnamed protein product [Dovyalis caffra]